MIQYFSNYSNENLFIGIENVMKANYSKMSLVGTFVYNDAYALFNLTNEINKYRFYLPVCMAILNIIIQLI